MEKRYQMLTLLLSGGKSAAELSSALDLSMPTLWSHYELLRKEGLVLTRCKDRRINGYSRYVIRLTPAGREKAHEMTGKPPEGKQVQLYPCGHPVAPSTRFCLKCRYEKRERSYA